MPYVIQDQMCVIILITLQKMIRGSNATNLTKVFKKNLMIKGGLIQKAMSCKLKKLLHKPNRVTIFQSAKIKVTQ
jgi:hypothetical protein